MNQSDERPTTTLYVRDFPVVLQRQVRAAAVLRGLDVAEMLAILVRAGLAARDAFDAGLGVPPTEPLDRLQIRVATDVEQRDAILKWAQEAHRTGSGHDCGEWLAGHRCTVCGSWVDEDDRDRR